MSLESQVVSIPFSQGIDTKTDPKALPQGELISLQDGVFTNTNRISKRNGYSSLNLSIEGGGTITNPLLTQSYNSELLIADGTNLYSYSPSTGTGLCVNKGSYQSVSVTDKEISIYSPAVPGASDAAGPVFPSLAVLGNFTLFSYISAGLVFVSVMDNVSQSFLLQDFSIAGTLGATALFSKAVLLSGTTLAVVYNDLSNNLNVQILTISGTGASFGAPIVIAPNVNPTTPNIEYSSGSTHNYICYHYSSGGQPDAVGIVDITSAGAVTAASFIATSYVPSFIVCQQDASSNAWFYWVNGTTTASNVIHYKIYAPSFASVVLTDTIIASGVPNISRISPSIQASGHQFIYYSSNTQGPASLFASFVSTFYGELSTSGVVSTGNTFLLNSELQSKWINYFGINYAVFMSIPGVRVKNSGVPGVGEQNTYFLISESTRLAVSKALFGEAVYDNGDQYIGNLILSGTTILFSAQFIFFNDVENLSNVLSSVPLTGVSQISFNFSDYEAYQGILVGNVAAFNGGIVQQYDGKAISELGFNVFPENVVPTKSSGGGTILAGTYSYAAVYEWYDATGNFHSSGTQLTLSQTTTGSTSSVSVVVQTLLLTAKLSAITISLYRTLSGGTIYYKVQQKQNDPTVNFITLVDTIPDSQIQAFTGGDLQLYTAGNVVENNAPPPAMVMMSNQNRLWLIDSESPSNTIWYSKTYSPGNGLAFSNFLTLTIDSKLGNITVLKGMDEKTCIIKQNGVFFSTGDGADDTGSNSTFSSPQLVPSDVGALYSRGSIVIPDGTVFKTLKGLYILSRGLSVEYFGAPAQSFNTQNLEASDLAPRTSQVRFLTSSGYAIAYDYIFKKWATFSNHTGYSSTVWQGHYVYVRTDGTVFQENPGYYLDGPTASFALTLQLAWIKSGSIQGFQRIWRIIMLGDHLSPVAGHKVQISAAYDYGSSFSVPVAYSLFGTNSVIQYREKVPRGKCDSIGLLIQEVVTGNSGEYIDLTDLSLEVAVKKGVNKMPGVNSVG